MSHILLLSWERIARLCPLECNIHHQINDLYICEVVNEVPFYLQDVYFIRGDLTATWLQVGFLFNHPGLSGGNIFIQIHELRALTLKHGVFIEYL